MAEDPIKAVCHYAHASKPHASASPPPAWPSKPETAAGALRSIWRRCSHGRSRPAKPPARRSDAATLADVETAPIEQPLRATLRMLGKLTRDHTIDAEDIRDVLSAGVSRAQVEDALAVCLAFDITARLANAFDFAMVTPAAMDAGARQLLKRGYR